MRPHLNYFLYVIRHKWFVFWAGTRLGVPLHQLILHDYDKLLPGMWIPYVNRFYKQPLQSREAYYHNPELADLAFNRAWLSHLNRQKHHWQHWIILLDAGSRPDGQRRWLEQAYSDLHPSEITEYVGEERQGHVTIEENPLNGEVARRISRLLDDANRPDPLVLPMPERFIREMVADWSGAGRAQGHGNDVIPWYRKNRDKMQLHPETRGLVEALVQETAEWQP